MCRAGQGQRHYAMVLAKDISAANLNGECRWLGTNRFAIVQTLGPLSCPFPPVCNFTPSNEVKRYSRQEAGGAGPPPAKSTRPRQSLTVARLKHISALTPSLSLRPPASKFEIIICAFCTKPSIVKFSYSQILPNSSKSKWVRDPD